MPYIAGPVQMRIEGELHQRLGFSGEEQDQGYRGGVP